MKNYRTSVADAFAMMRALESISESADSFAKSAADMPNVPQRIQTATILITLSSL